ncbi:MAG: GntR family transcriptional regulator [Betaproteobacteria bacterium]|jgi:GntR family transcriptional regulator, vanillate catabolism transcriptional regulator|nr:GntR family transcriptional regulator [Betaproteobacteria bacterium]NBP44560.1 GntR family transcriptional regulator [Betaproteobacteria bacterium]
MKLADRPSSKGDLADSTTQAVKVQNRLRDLILAGTLPAGERITEMALVDKLGASRTPIRAALMRLEQEGLLQPYASGGYAIRRFTVAEAADAIELRGLLEGWAARRLAEQGAKPASLAQAKDILTRLDTVLACEPFSDEVFSNYVLLNHEFHEWLSEACASATIQKEMERVCSLPFASPNGFVTAQSASTHARARLLIAQDQHWQVLGAIEAREGARAEALMREHSRLAQRNLYDVSLASAQVPGAALIDAPLPQAAALTVN